MLFSILVIDSILVFLFEKSFNFSHCTMIMSFVHVVMMVTIVVAKIGAMAKIRISQYLCAPI